MKLKMILLVAAQMPALLYEFRTDCPAIRRKDRREFRHAIFGIEGYSLSDDRVLYTLNAHKLFVPGSVTKVVTHNSPHK